MSILLKDLTEEQKEEKLKWEERAKSIVEDLGFALKRVSMSTLYISPSRVYINAETKEGERMCIEHSRNGFKVVSNCYDTVQNAAPDKTVYETPHALFDHYSPLFMKEFGDELRKKHNDKPPFSV